MNDKLNMLSWKKNSGAYKTQKIYTSLAADTRWPTVSTRETNTKDAQSPVMTIFVRNIPAGRLRGGRVKADEQGEHGRVGSQRLPVHP